MLRRIFASTLHLLFAFMLLSLLTTMSNARYSDYITSFTVPMAQDYFGTAFITPDMEEN